MVDDIMLSWHYIIIFIVFSLIADKALGLSCLQCLSVQNEQCLEGKLKPSPCNNPNATHCAKASVDIDEKGGIFIFRTCVYQRLNQTCQLTNIMGYEAMLCFETCREDGCNGSSLPSIPSALFIIPVVVTVSYYLGAWTRRTN